ncbi:MAG: PepSY-like domain-containing protein [Flavobacteriales bacterium]|nr:PepSY-like domain-containing protein [Flavobacteriales bacterium]
MKTPLMILSVLALSVSACGQKVSEADVPQPVKAAFMKQFPKADHAHWGMESKTEYEVEFKQGSESMSATYGNTGEWMETEKDLKLAALPAPVRATIAQNYADQKLGDISHVDSPKGELYEVDMEKGEQSMEVVFSTDGKVMKEKMEEKGNDEDNDND